ncbi:hypothetical protein RK21_04141 [Pseudomonas plecoglossicida]|nr:hypothetical protein RK21_04141 [Pseudomonas plecoglossicida]
MGAALAAKNPTQCMAPAAPVFAAKAAPTGSRAFLGSVQND